MSNSKRILLPLLVAALLVVQMMSPFAVFADGETPPETSEATDVVTPPEEPLEETEPVPPEETIVAAEETPAEETVEAKQDTLENDQQVETTEETLVDEIPATEAVEEPASEPEETQSEEVDAPADLTVAEALEQAPEGTEIVVINEAGEVEPLATEEAAQIVEIVDPIWCPGTQEPTPNANGCTGSYTTVTDLITELLSDTTKYKEAGTVYFTSTYSTPDATFDGGTLTALTDLTIQGGWNGASGAGYALAGSTTFDSVPLNVTNWDGNVTLNDIVVNGSSSTGITVETTGDINLENVSSSNNNGDGAWLDNCIVSSTTYTCTGTGKITLTETNTFNGNGANGLDALSNGNITLNNVTASNNDVFGAYLNNEIGGTGTGNINLTGTNVFNSNGSTGLQVYSNGSIAPNNITANNNTYDGASLRNFHHGKTGTITLTGTNVFNGNAGIGLQAYSNGHISLNNVTANQNIKTGAYLDTCNRPGVGLGCSNTAFTNVSLTGTNTFNNNGNSGLQAETYSSNMEINNLTANNNTVYGANIYSRSLTMTGSNTFNNNKYGLSTRSGNIVLNNVTANNNTDTGAWMEASSGKIFLTGTNTFSGNDIGLWAWSHNGEIIINNLTAANNINNGAQLFTTFFGGTHNITLTGNNLFHDNGGYGLYTLTNGDITLYNVTAYNHSGTALWLDPNPLPADITLNCGNISDNGLGVDAILSGALTFNAVNFNNNSVDYLKNGSGAGAIINSNYNCNPGGGGKKVVIYPSKPINQVSASSGITELNCSDYKGTQFTLPDGSFAYFPCPISDSASVSALELENLPGGVTALSGFTTAVTKNGTAVSTLPAYATLSFLIPAGVDPASLSILFWNGSEWVEQSGFLSADGMYYQATVNFSGDFVLVSK